MRGLKPHTCCCRQNLNYPQVFSLWVESITDDNVESNCSIIEKIPPKGVSFSDFICIFAMSSRVSYTFCDTKICEISAMTKS